MEHASLKVRAFRSYLPWQGDDDVLGESLVDLVRGALARGGAPPVAVTVRGDRVDMFPLAEVVSASVAPHVFLAALSRSQVPEGMGVDVVALMGAFRLHRDRERRDPGVPAAMVFMEWTDCRWWQWRGLVEGGEVRPDTETIDRAVDGMAKPARLGGWFSLARRKNLSIRLEPNPAIVH